jgi:hypothetical protein
MEYRVVRRLGRGGMGVVDLATDADGRLVALKRLALHGSPEEVARARTRIRREAEVLASLEHPAIVPLVDLVDDADDLVLVMPYFPGGTLHDRVLQSGPLHPNEVDTIADRLLDALAAAHRQGVVHRDIKPANVLFDADGQAHLVDFGVASARDHTVGLTASEMVVGTPGFMAPEQARGEAATAAADVFSLGATLAFAATGSGPFGPVHADPRVLMWRAATGKMERLPRTLPAELRNRLAPMLERDPGRRPSAARVRGGPEGTWPRTGLARAAGRHRAAAVGLAALVAVVGLGAVVALLAEGVRGRSPGSDAADRPGQSTATTTITTQPCPDLRYQPCGEDAAPNTDGRRCVDDHGDYDGDRANGCEAVPDGVADGSLVEGEVTGNLVPRADVDTWTVAVEDRFQFSCDGTVTVTLTAPAGASMRATVTDADGTELADTTSADGSPGSVDLTEPTCAGDDSGTLEVVVSSVGSDRSPEEYTLEVTGSY